MRCKASTQRHAVRRARERYDIWLEIEDIQAMNQIIRSGLCWTIETRSKRRGKKVIIKWLNGAYLAAVYDPKKRTIATFLPWQAAEVRRTLAKRAQLSTA